MDRKTPRLVTSLLYTLSLKAHVYVKSVTKTFSESHAGPGLCCVISTNGRKCHLQPGESAVTRGILGPPCPRSVPPDVILSH